MRGLISITKSAFRLSHSVNVAPLSHPPFHCKSPTSDFLAKSHISQQSKVRYWFIELHPDDQILCALGPQSGPTCCRFPSAYCYGGVLAGKNGCHLRNAINTQGGQIGFDLFTEHAVPGLRELQTFGSLVTEVVSFLRILRLVKVALARSGMVWIRCVTFGGVRVGVVIRVLPGA